jgi:hypothetical protein
VAVAIGILLLLTAGAVLLSQLQDTRGLPRWLVMRSQWFAPIDPAQDDDDVLRLPVPVPDPAAGLGDSPLNAFLKPNLSPQEQTDIIGQLLLDYWNNLRTLPAGTWEEVCAELSGQNAKNISFVDRNHPALRDGAFRSSANAPGIHVHVISSSGGAFQLIYDGPDAKPFTDDDLIRNFPMDLDY